MNLYSEEEDTQAVPNDSMLRDHETVRSKMFEDSDASTFRMISFGGGMGSRQRSKVALEPQTAFQTQMQTNQNTNTASADDSNGIDFYASQQQQQQLYQTGSSFRAFDNLAQTQDFKKGGNCQPGVREVIMEENL